MTRYARRSMTFLLILPVLTFLIVPPCYAAPGGFLTKDGQRLFPIGFYELPGDEAGLQSMADAGVNLVRCRNRADLDRVHAAGMQGVMPLPFQKGAADDLRAQVKELAGHPALAIWEGPDEVVWNFTAYSGLHRKLGIHKVAGAWWKQTPEAIAYAEKKAAEIIPNMRAAVAMIHELDPAKRPIWINEARHSDTGYVRQYYDFVDITGCDIYPVKADKRPIEDVGHSTRRWMKVGRDKPVYMVLQAFSWNELGDYYGATEVAYPSFEESRTMAYDAIAIGAHGILYWGSNYMKSGAFRQSIYALTSELAALQPFLVKPAQKKARLDVIERPDRRPVNVQMTCRKAGKDWLIILANEDPRPHMGVVVEGLKTLEERTMHLLYTDRSTTVRNGELIARMKPYETQVFCTSRTYETPKREGRDFGATPPETLEAKK